MLEILKLEIGKKEFDSFFKVPYLLQNFPFSKENYDREKKQLSLKNIFFEHAKGCGFVVKDNGEFKGRIFASVDESLIQNKDNESKFQKVIGHIGYICVKEELYYRKLIEEAERWLKNKGVTHIHGPLNLNILNGYRLQVDGFRTDPFPGEPRNPGYYKKFFEQSGYKVLNSWNSWDLNPDFIRLSANHASAISKKVNLKGVTIRSLNIKKFENEISNICDCALESFSLNYGIAQISKKEFVQSLSHLKPLMRENLFYILQERNGKVGGFIMGYQDDPLKPKRIIFHTVALNKKWQKTNAAYLLAEKICNTVSSLGYYGIGAFAKEGKSTFDRLGPPTRRYSMFEKVIL